MDSHDTLFVDVIVPLSVANKFTYRIPKELNESIAVGKRVIVQFGKSKFYTAVVYAVHSNPPKEYIAKYIETILDDEPIVTPAQLQLWDWISHYYVCNPGDVMNAALPSGLKLSSTSHITLNPDFSLDEMPYDYFTEKEHMVLEALQASSSLSFDDISIMLSLKTVQVFINKLIKKGAVVIYEEIKDKYKPKLVDYIGVNASLLKDELQLKEVLDTLEKKAFKQAEVLLSVLHLLKTEDTAKQLGLIKKSLLLKTFDTAVIKALVKKEVLIETELETSRLLFDNKEKTNKTLNEFQLKAVKDIETQFETKQTVLLHGVTGSGKTEIYSDLIDKVITQGKQVLYLVPEIALTTQLINRIRAVFGNSVGIYHSKFSENERVEIWNSILHEGDNKLDAKHFNIVLGTRSALFLPFNNLGLIIIDEEHDNSYKQQDPAPRYHARDAAMYLANLHKAKVLLGTATPSFESYYNALHQKFGLVRIAERFGKATLPDTVVCDLKKETQQQQNKGIFSHQLVTAITQALVKKEQVILFQNRRGFAPYTECANCNWIPHCVHCDVALIYHKQTNKLSCHYCGYTMQPPTSCGACGNNNLKYKGFGTEKIEEEIEILFPSAKVARMDLDTTRSKYAYKQLIDEFELGNIDILVGTQMVTKGLDFDHVSVVGVLNVDSVLNFPDFRSFEKAYQLIVQVSGRAGRKDKKGTVYIQTNHPEHSVINHVLADNYLQFYQSQINEREQFHYPPFTRIIELSVVSKDPNVVNDIAQQLANQLKPLFGGMMLGPEFPLVAKIKDQYHKRILLKINREYSPTQVRNLLKQEMDTLQYNNKKSIYRLQVDADPV
ncbi:MAG: primosomal protein [Bacteroidetes bacterium]|jgi:primosomal protein N' (replication factor Y)|nr:primosomal protein [Bacteroidota bacterium]